jgi:putative colanic acid biosynthesis acetyltransferase WcaF
MSDWQDLSRFKLPPDFHGRPAWFVQPWWLVDALLFRSSPQFLYGWRCWLLRLFGARIGCGVIVRPGALVQRQWTWDVVASQLTAEYEKVIARHRDARSARGE